MAMWLFISTSVGALASLGFRAWLVEGKRGGREGGREEGEGKRGGRGEGREGGLFTKCQTVTPPLNVQYPLKRQEERLRHLGICIEPC
jgi:hypothetical protein